jgi:hypothetical protein
MYRSCLGSCYTAMNASRETMAKTVFMDGRDNGPAMTNPL